MVKLVPIFMTGAVVVKEWHKLTEADAFLQVSLLPAEFSISITRRPLRMKDN